MLRGAIPLCVLCACAGVRAHGGRHASASLLFCRILGGVAMVPKRFGHRGGEARLPLERGEKEEDGERRSGGPGGEGELGRKTRLRREILCALQLLVWIGTRWCAGTPARSGGGRAKHMVNG